MPTNPSIRHKRPRPTVGTSRTWTGRGKTGKLFWHRTESRLLLCPVQYQPAGNRLTSRKAADSGEGEIPWPSRETGPSHQKPPTHKTTQPKKKKKKKKNQKPRNPLPRFLHIHARQPVPKRYFALAVYVCVCVCHNTPREQCPA